MVASQSELILEQIKARLIAGRVATERNADVPVIVPAEGMAILRDGDPGDPERVLGGFESVYYTHTIELELFVQGVTETVRDERYDALLSKVGAILYTDTSLGGLIFGFHTTRPEPQTIPVEGGVPIKAAVLIIIAEYQPENPLA